MVCLLFGAVTGLQLALSWQANRTAAADTEQLIRVQGIKTNLLRADALATNAFLIGGLEPAEQRAAYDGAIDQTVRAITDAAEAQPADRAALNELSSAVLDYVGDMELARANNRQGLPVGGAYLRKASSELRSTALPIVDQLVDSNSTRTTDAMGAHHPWWVFLPAVVAVVLLWFANRWIGRRFHRRVNPGILVAVLAVGVVGIVAAFLVNGQQNQNDELTDGSFQSVVDGSSARTSANDAKANESLRLIARGSGQAFEDAWVAAAAIVDQALLEPSLNGLQGSWATYKSQHQEIVDLDDGGDWDEAVVAATSTEDGSASDTFADFDAQLQDSLSASGTATTETLTNGNSVLLVLAVLAHPGGPGRGRVRGVGRQPAPQGVLMTIPTAGPARRGGADARPRGVRGHGHARPGPACPAGGLGWCGAGRPGLRQPAAVLRAGQRPAGHPVRLDDGRDPPTRAVDRRRLGRHVPARRPRPGQRRRPGLRHRPGQAGREGDLR